MTDRTRTQASSDLLREAIKRRFPDFTNEQIQEIMNHLLNYIADKLEDGWEIATVRKEGDSLDLNVLSIVSANKE